MFRNSRGTDTVYGLETEFVGLGERGSVLQNRGPLPFLFTVRLVGIAERKERGQGGENESGKKGGCYNGPLLFSTVLL